MAGNKASVIHFGPFGNKLKTSFQGLSPCKGQCIPAQQSEAPPWGSGRFENMSGHRMKYLGADLKGNNAADIYIESGHLGIDNDSVDIVFSSQVLEHVQDVPGYLAECRRILKSQGLLLLSTHGFWTYHGYPDDFCRWTFHGLRYVIESNGFSVTKMIPCVGPLAYTTHLRTQLIRGLLYKLGRWTLPLIGILNMISAILMRIGDAITPRDVKYQNAAIYIVEARKQ